jgi:uncharacterized membrane protein YqgA involved in biofilm formation
VVVRVIPRRNRDLYWPVTTLRFTPGRGRGSVLRVTGAILNAAGIIIGGVIGLARTTPLAPQTQNFFKLMLGAATLLFGLRLTWSSIGGTFGGMLKQLVIAFLALALGNLLGKLLRLQKASNYLGQYARRLIETNRPNDPHRFSNGLNACAILFCAAPLGILGAVQDGLPVVAGADGYFQILGVKAVMDGLAMLGFVALFGGGAIVAALPVFVFQGTITLACQVYLEPFLRTHGLVDAVNAAGGLAVCTVGVVIFEIRRVELADYLPALAVAPLLTWLWK